MTRSKGWRFRVLMGLATAAMAATWPGGAQAQDKGRTEAEIRKDLNTAGVALRDAAPEDQAVNPEYREKLREKMVPLLAKSAGLFRELYATVPTAKNESLMTADRIRAELAYFGDKEEIAGLEKDAQARNRDDATFAQLGLLLVRWWNAAENEKDQAQILDEVEPILKTMPKSSHVPACLKHMVDENPATVAIASRIEDLIATSESNWAKSYDALPNKVGKPLVVEGHDLAGKAFSTAHWKGKVVMLDFWASWCKPCDQQAPHVAELYKKFHAKGLEIVGVNSDVKRGELEAFLKSHPGMDWPELFTEGNKEFEPTTKSFGITAIPTMYFLDREGILRTTNGDQDPDEWIPKLLAEKRRPK